jgi:transposase
MVQMKDKIAVLLMEAGVSYNKQKLHKVRPPGAVATNPDINDGPRSLLRLCQETAVRLGKTESCLSAIAPGDWMLQERIERLIPIPGVGPVTAGARGGGSGNTTGR